MVLALNDSFELTNVMIFLGTKMNQNYPMSRLRPLNAVLPKSLAKKTKQMKNGVVETPDRLSRSKILQP